MEAMRETTKEQVIVQGVVDDIIFQNIQNGFTVFSLESNDSNTDGLICVGSLDSVASGESIRLSGSYVMHPVYGRQLSVETYEKVMPTTLDGLERYLGSGVIKGMREKLAKKIVARFGQDTLTVLEEYPEKLTEIKGITLEKAMSISAVFHEQAEMRRVMLFLQEYGISSSFALKIYKKFKENTYDIVRTNPYALADEIFGVGFKTADAIAFRAGIENDSEYRIRSGVQYTLHQGISNGHVYLPKSVLLGMTAELLDLPADAVERCMTMLQMERVVWQETVQDDTAVYLNAYHNAEQYVAKKLLDLSQNVTDKSKGLSARIARVEKETGVTLAENQKRAVTEAMKHGVLIITGGPGTGKTTTINTVISILEEDGHTIELAAPTGRAAKRMAEATGREAKTIHRLLEIAFLEEDARRQTFGRNEENPIEAEIVIIDESSMVDILLMSSLLKAIAAGTRLILVGDVDQLPSVGPGNVLKDIIASGCLEVVRLTEIFRQAQESAIVMNAHRINRGERPVLNEKNKDFFFVRRAGTDEVLQTIVDLVTKRLPGYISCQSIFDIQVLTPMRKSPLGVGSLNELLQKALNPPSPTKKEKEYRHIVFREGDKVMQIKNNYNMTWRIFDNTGRQTDEGLGVFNGDTGTVKSINEFESSVTICFDDMRVVEYDFSQLDELELSYAITIHKSQGSEYKVVVIPIHSGPPMLMHRNLLYTGITRAKELAVIVGIPDTLYKMVDNDREVNRYTALQPRIQKIDRFMREGFSAERKDE